MRPDETRGARGRSRLVLGMLAGTLRRRPLRVAAIVAWSAAGALPALAFGRSLAGAADAFATGRVAAGLAWLAVLALAAPVAAVASRLLYPQIAGIVEPFRDELVERVVDGALRRSMRPGAPPDTGAVARLTHHVEIVRDTFAGMVTIVGTFAFTTGGALLGLITLAPVGAAFVVPPLVAALALFLATLRPSALRQRRSILADEAVAEAAGAAVGDLRDVVACGAGEQVAGQVASHVDAQAGAARAVAGMGAVRTLVLAVGGWLPLAAILVAAPWLLGHAVTAGTILGLLAYVRGGVQPALHTLVHGVGRSGMRLAVTLERIVEASGDPSRPDRPAPAAAAPAGRPPGGDVELRGVTFAYGPTAEPVIHDLDLVIPDGDHLAVVGPSGIGKSTLAGLLAGTLRPLAGGVRLGGVPLEELEGTALTRRRVLIPQQAYVFAGTLRENLTYLDPEAGPEALDAAVEAIGLRPLLERVGGLEADVEPAALSAGERQLVALARSYLSAAPLALLDEATCHLDPGAEARVEQAFARRPGTLVVIAHRVSSALRARRILVLDGTRAIAGTHQALLAGSSLYRDLVGHWWSAGSWLDARDPAAGRPPLSGAGGADGRSDR